MKRALSSLLACGGFVLAAIILPAQDGRGAPENANEARLNKLQPPGQVMDIIGAAAGMTIAEWVPEKDGRGEGTTPEKMRAQMESAGFTLERIDKSLEANELYIYLFRPGSGHRRSGRPRPSTSL